jgi:hypothetical protein
MCQHRGYLPKEVTRFVHRSGRALTPGDQVTRDEAGICNSSWMQTRWKRLRERTGVLARAICCTVDVDVMVAFGLQPSKNAARRLPSDRCPAHGRSTGRGGECCRGRRTAECCAGGHC